MCYDKEKISSEAKDFYSSLFVEDHVRRPSFEDIEMPSISVPDSISLEKPFTEEEVKNVIWNFGTNKAPSPDGFTMDFF